MLNYIKVFKSKAGSIIINTIIICEEEIIFFISTMRSLLTSISCLAFHLCGQWLLRKCWPGDMGECDICLAYLCQHFLLCSTTHLSRYLVTLSITVLTLSEPGVNFLTFPVYLLLTSGQFFYHWFVSIKEPM